MYTYKQTYPVTLTVHLRTKTKTEFIKTQTISMESKGFKDIKKHILTSQLFVGQPDQIKCIENVGFRVAVEHNINHIFKNTFLNSSV